MLIELTMPTKIFISYRREDSEDITGRIYDRLEQRFGRDNVFHDIDTIPLGVDFRMHLDQAVGQCDVLLVIIGEDWLDVRHPTGPKQNQRRLDDPADFVRIEIGSALARDIPVIPVLVGKMRMPGEDELPEALQPLAYRNATEVRSGRDFRDHVDRLIRGIEYVVQQVRAKNRTEVETYPVITEQQPSAPVPVLQRPPSRFALRCMRRGEGVQVPYRPIYRFKALTVEFWIKPDMINPFDVIFRNNTDWEDGIGLDFNPDRLLRFYVNTWASMGHCVLGEIPLGKWSHIAGSYDGLVIRLYINGREVDNRACPEGIRYSQDPTMTIAVTAWRTGTYQLYGSLAEVRVWDEARHLAQINANMNRLLQGDELGLVAYYCCDDSASARECLLDRSRNGNHGNWVGMPEIVNI